MNNAHHKFQLLHNGNPVVTLPSVEEARSYIPSGHVPVPADLDKGAPQGLTFGIMDEYSIQRTNVWRPNEPIERFVLPIGHNQPPRQLSLSISISPSLIHNNLRMRSHSGDDLEAMHKAIPSGYLSPHDWEIKFLVEGDDRFSLGFEPQEQEHYCLSLGSDRNGSVERTNPFYFYARNPKQKLHVPTIGVEFFGVITKADFAGFISKEPAGTKAPVEGAFEGLQGLQEYTEGGVTIFVIGDSPAIKARTMDWFYEHDFFNATGIPPSRVLFKGGQNMTYACRRFRIDSVIHHQLGRVPNLEAYVSRIWDFKHDRFGRSSSEYEVSSWEELMNREISQRRYFKSYKPYEREDWGIQINRKVVPKK